MSELSTVENQMDVVEQVNQVLPDELPAGTGGGEMNAQLNGNVATGGNAEMPIKLMDGGKKPRKSRKSKKSKKSKASKKSRRNKSHRK
jgi:hypothetical protein